jgi:3-dehydroquinate synthase
MYEVIKTGFIRDAALAAFISQNLSQIQALESVPLTHIIKRCCEIKAEIVMADEREGGLRRILNFGHTVGHALEAVTKYRRLKHGEAVGYGMQCAADIGTRAGTIAPVEAATIKQGVAALGRLPRIGDLSVAEIAAAMAHDKKATQGKIPFILPTRIGEVIVRDDIPPQLVRSAIRTLVAEN